MIIFLYGNDSYRILERLQFLQQAFIDKFDERGMNIAEIDGEQFDINEFRKHTKSAGLFTQKRFIAFRNLWSLVKDQQEELLDELDTIDEDTILCITAAPPPRKNNKLFKRLLNAETVEQYEELNPQQLRSFIQKKCKEFGARIDAAAVDHLSASIGNDLWRQSLEIKKLASYTDNITSDVVAEFVDKAIDENIFHLTDALGTRNCKQASSLLQQQHELGANPQYLITMLARQVANLLKVKKTDGKGLQMHPYVKEKSLEQSKHFSEQDLNTLYWRLLEIDQQLKTSAADPKVLLDLFILEACTTEA